MFWIKVIIGIVATGVYLGVMYHSAFAADSGARTLFLTILAWAGFVAYFLWQNGQRIWAVVLCLSTLPLFFNYSYLAKVEWLNLVPNTLIYGSLAFAFGRTLVGDRMPLITELALKIHNNQLPEPIRKYTRSLTLAWCLFFLITTLLGIYLYFGISFTAFSLFSNVYGMPLLLGFFAVEYAYRRWRFPNFEHVSITAGMNAFMKQNEKAKPVEAPETIKKDPPKS